MRIVSRLALISAGASLGLAAVAVAATPALLDGAVPGLWEVSRSGQPATRICLAAVAELAQFEHREASCERDLVGEAGTTAKFHYSCGAGGFGSSRVTLLTPRSLRVETQGISDNAPFKYTFQARHAGNC